MTRIRDVAIHAGVSVATVSRIMNNTRYVSAELEDRVRKALEELDYAPNLAARRLRSRKTNTISFINLDLGYLKNPFLNEVAEGVEQTAAAYGYSMIVRSIKDEAKSIDNYVRALDGGTADGAIVAGALNDSILVQLLQARSYPFVLVSRHISGLQTNFVGMDDYGGMIKVINYLAGLGHRSIALISGDERSSAVRDRLKGYLDGLTKWNIPFRPELVAEGRYDPSSGYTAANQFLSLRPAPTAIISVTDRMAFGAWRYLREVGLNVPHDISLVGFDDIECSSLSPIGLTTVRLPKNEIGEKAVEILISLLADKNNHKPVELVLPVELVVRDTCAPPPLKSDC